jgi:hypothetical protein
MNLLKRKNHSVSFHYWGWTARPFFLRLTAVGEAFVLTSPFIERSYRQLGIWVSRITRRRLQLAELMTLGVDAMPSKWD